MCMELSGYLRTHCVLRRSILAMAAPMLVSVPLWAQATGAIVGTVTDPTGAVIPNAKVTATRVDTHISQFTVTSGSGTYTIPNLPVGTYDVNAEGQGFKPAVAKNITLDVTQQREVSFKLSVAGVESAVEVNATPPLLNTTDGTLGGLVTAQQVQ